MINWQKQKQNKSRASIRFIKINQNFWSMRLNVEIYNLLFKIKSI